VEQKIHVIDICKLNPAKSHPLKVTATGGRPGGPRTATSTENYNAVSNIPAEWTLR